MELVRDRMASRQHDLKLYLEHQPPGERLQARESLTWPD